MKLHRFPLYSIVLLQYGEVRLHLVPAVLLENLCGGFLLPVRPGLRPLPVPYQPGGRTPFPLTGLVGGPSTAGGRLLLDVPTRRKRKSGIYP